MNLRGAIGGLGKGIADMGKTGFESEIMRMREENLARFRAQLQEESAVSQHGRTLERDTIQHDRTLESATVAHERGGFWSQTLGREVTREELGGMNPEQIKELDIRDKAPGHTPPDTTKYTGKYTDIEGNEWAYNPANPDDRIKLGKGPYSAGGVRASTPGSGAGGGASSGANHTAVNSAVKASQEIINGYPPGKKMTPDERKQFDALLGTVNDSRAAAGLDPFTTDIAENQRIWRQDQHVLQGYNTTGTTPDPSGGEPQEPPPIIGGGGENYLDLFFRENQPTSTRTEPPSGRGLAHAGTATDYVMKRPEPPPGLAPPTQQGGIIGRPVPDNAPSAILAEMTPERAKAIDQMVKAAGSAILPVANLIETRFKELPEAREIWAARNAKDFKRMAAAVASAAAKSSEVYEALTGVGSAGVAEYNPETNWGTATPLRF